MTILPTRPGPNGWAGHDARQREPGDATGAAATLGGATITGDPWRGTWDALPAGPHTGISLTVKAITTIVKIDCDP